MVSILCSINYQLQTQSQQLSTLMSVISNLSVVSPLSCTDAEDNDKNLTGNTDNLFITYLNADKRSNFHVSRD